MPHNLMTSGELFARHLPDLDIRFEHEEDFEHAMSFIEDGMPEDGLPALDFDVRFSPGKSTTFTYDEEKGLYLIRQLGAPHIDGNTDKQIAVTNVLILRTSVSGIPGDREGRLNVVTTGSGVGYFVNGGKYIEINWYRDDESSQFTFTLHDGSELIFGQGKTYVCIVRNNTEMDFS